MIYNNNFKPAGRSREYKFYLNDRTIEIAAELQKRGFNHSEEWIVESILTYAQYKDYCAKNPNANVSEFARSAYPDVEIKISRPAIEKRIYNGCRYVTMIKFRDLHLRSYTKNEDNEDMERTRSVLIHHFTNYGISYSTGMIMFR